MRYFEVQTIFQQFESKIFYILKTLKTQKRL